MGRMYQRGRLWWIQYYRRGQLCRESSRSALKSVASALLKKREGEIADGRLPNLYANHTTFEDLVRLYRQDLELNRPTALIRLRSLVAHLRTSFAGLLATEITTPRLTDYLLRRRAQGAANATLNRELGALRRMFHLAAQQTPPLVLHLPAMPHLRERNVRKGFYTEEQYQVLRAALPDHLKIPFIIGYWTGMRAGEILKLEWTQINLDERWLRLEPGTTKTDRGRIIPLAEEEREVLVRWRDWTLLHYPACPWVCHYRGKRLQRIPRKTWRRICEHVGLPGRLFHDLRRTAVRDMLRAGIPERVAMEISGHRTRSVFDRYHIVSESDLFEAVSRLEQRRNSRAMSTISSTVAGSDAEADEVTR